MLAQQKQLLNKRLGLDVAGGSLNTGELFAEEDLILHRMETSSNANVLNYFMFSLLFLSTHARDGDIAVHFCLAICHVLVKAF